MNSSTVTVFSNLTNFQSNIFKSKKILHVYQNHQGVLFEKADFWDVPQTYNQNL